MTVKDLKNILNNLDEDVEVYVNGYEGKYDKLDVFDVKLIGKVFPHKVKEYEGEYDESSSKESNPDVDSGTINDGLVLLSKRSRR